MKKVLVTGSEGYIGRNLFPLLLKQKFTVRPFDKRLSPKQDILDVDALKKCMHACDYVFNLAAMPGVKQCDENRESAYRNNVVGATNVVEIATSLGCKPVLFSSFAVEGPSYYGKTKAEMERVNKDHAVILRLSNVFGGQDYKKLKSSGFLSGIAKDDPIRFINYQARGPTRDFVHIRIVLDWCLKGMELPFGVHKICTGFQVPVETVALIAGMIRDVEVECNDG